MLCEKGKCEAHWGCVREHVPEPNADKNMKGKKVALGGKFWAANAE